MITEDYVSFEIAKLLKEKRFDCNTNCYYIEDSDTRTLFYSPIRENHNASIENNEFNIHINISSGKMSAPTLQMAMKWLRETFEIHCQIDCPIAASNWRYGIRDMNQDEWVTLRNMGNYETYEEACEEAIRYCLENLI